MLDEPRCWTRICKHFQGVRYLDESIGEASEVVFCPAFPNGIPRRIAYGDDLHDKVAKDQVGAIVYERSSERDRHDQSQPDEDLRADVERDVGGPRPSTCPACGSPRVAVLLYGLPPFTATLQREIDAGRVALGGCEVWDGMPRWQCAACRYKWDIREVPRPPIDPDLATAWQRSSEWLARTFRWPWTASLGPTPKPPGQPDSITVGRQTVTAGDLLRDFLDVWRLSPSFRDWTATTFRADRPRLIRLRRLIALFRAYGLPWDPEAFANGEFIRVSDRRYDAVFSRLAAELPEDARRENRDRSGLPQYFRTLLWYRALLNKALTFGNGLLAASGLYLLAHLKARQANQLIAAYVASIDDALAMVISPEQTTFSVEILIKDYGYPEDNLEEVDLESW